MPRKPNSSSPTGTDQPDGGELEQGQLDLQRKAKNAAQALPSDPSFVLPLPATGKSSPTLKVLPYDQSPTPPEGTMAPPTSHPAALPAEEPTLPVEEPLIATVEPEVIDPATAQREQLTLRANAESRYVRLKGFLNDCCAIVPKVGKVLEWGMKRAEDAVELVIRLITGAVIPLIHAVQNILTAACAAALILVVGSFLEAGAPEAQDPKSDAVQTSAVTEEPSSVTQVWHWIDSASPETKAMSGGAALLALLFRRRIMRLLEKWNGEEKPPSRAVPADETSS